MCDKNMTDNMKHVVDGEFGGERALFAVKNVQLTNCVFHAGESALKRTSNIVAERCRFEGKYPFWHTDGFRVTDCVFTPGARAALWYSDNLTMLRTQVDAPKMFREMHNLHIEDVTIPDAAENPVELPQCEAAQRGGAEGRLSFHAQFRHRYRKLSPAGQLFFPVLPQCGDTQCSHRLERCFLGNRERHGLRF